MLFLLVRLCGDLQVEYFTTARMKAYMLSDTTARRSRGYTLGRG